MLTVGCLTKSLETDTLCAAAILSPVMIIIGATPPLAEKTCTERRMRSRKKRSKNKKAEKNKKNQNNSERGKSRLARAQRGKVLAAKLHDLSHNAHKLSSNLCM